VFQNRRWDGDFLTLQNLFQDGTLGDIYTIESNITAFGGAPGGWRAWQKYGGGRVRDWGAHLIDQALQLFGPTVETVFADFQYHYPEDRADVEALALIHLRFANGVRYFIELGSAWMYAKPRFHVRGSRGSFRKYGVDPQEAAMKMGAFGLPVPEDPARYQMRVKNDAGQTVEQSVSVVPGRYRTYYDNVGTAIAHGEDLLVKPEECLEAIRVIDAIMLSAEREEVIKLSS
jgi:predicted dehydrogenase